MSKELLFVLALIICVVLTFFYQKKVQGDLLKKLYVYKANHDQEGFMNTLDSSYTRFVFSKFTIEFMKLNYYLDHHDYLQAKEQFKKFNNMKLNDRNAIALNTRMFNGALEAKDVTLASNIKKVLMPILEKQKEENYKLIYGEIEQLDKIYIQKDVSIIPDLLEVLDVCKDDNIKSLLCFRLAKLYHYQKNDNEVNKYLSLAEKYSTTVENKESMRNLMKDHSGLD